MNEIKEIIVDYVNTKPEVNGIYAYGSAVFKQKGYTKKDKPLIDLILTVDNVKEWHLKNMILNKGDYSYTGKKFLSKYEKKPNNLGSEITYIPYLTHNGNQFKIGVISRKQLINDLKTWRSFFLPGRMQKPTLFIKRDDEVMNCIKENRLNGLILSLLFLKGEKSTEFDLYKKICSLSYLHDIRNFCFESPKKMENTVEKNFELFRYIYKNNSIWKEENSLIVTRKSIEELKQNLPFEFLSVVDKLYDKKRGKLSWEECALISLKRINFLDSSLQTLKGIRTAGPVKSMKYLKAKSKKFWNNIV